MPNDDGSKLPAVDERNVVRDAHRRRNVQLLRLLRSKHVNLDAAAFIEHHFWSSDHGSAVALAKSLYDCGYLILALSGDSNQPTGRVWNVEAGITQTPIEAASESTVTAMDKLAAKHKSEYDGWGMLV